MQVFSSLFCSFSITFYLSGMKNNYPPILCAKKITESWGLSLIMNDKENAGRKFGMAFFNLMFALSLS